MYDAKPMHRPGKRQAYHAVSGGNLLGEVVREITGKGIRDVLAEEILDPLGLPVDQLRRRPRRTSPRSR